MPAALIDGRGHVGVQVEAVQDDRLDPVDRDQPVEADRAVGQDPVGCHGVASHIRGLRIGVDDLDRGDVVIQAAVARRRIRDDHLARTVNRDRPLVPLPVRPRDHLALVRQQRTVRVIVLHQISHRVRNPLIRDRVGDEQVAGRVKRIVAGKCGGEQLPALQQFRCLELPAPGRIGPVRPMLHETHRRLPSRRLARRPSHRSCDRVRLPTFALPDSDAQPAKKRHARCTAPRIGAESARSLGPQSKPGAASHLRL